MEDEDLSVDNISGLYPPASNSNQTQQTVPRHEDAVTARVLDKQPPADSENELAVLNVPSAGVLEKSNEYGQTSRVRKNSDSSGTHSPREELSPYSSLVREKFEALALPYDTVDTSKRRERPNSETVDPTSVHHDVLPVPQQPGYEHIASPYIVTTITAPEGLSNELSSYECSARIYTQGDNEDESVYPVVQETNFGSPLEVATGSGYFNIRYPPSFLMESTPSLQNMPPSDRSTLSVDSPPYSSRFRNNSDSSGTHSPAEESSPYTSLESEKSEALAVPKSTAETASRRMRPHSTDTAVTVAKAVSTAALFPFQQSATELNPSEHVTRSNAVRYDPIEHPQYKDVQERQDSFKNWPHRSPSPRDLAEAGMFYAGLDPSDDTVRCYKCGQLMSQFQESDIPENEHRRLYPECSTKQWI